MKVTISANFDNVDFASTALSRVRKSTGGLKELRIKNRNGFDKQKPHTLAALSYYSQAPFDGVEYIPNATMPRGAFPIAFLDESYINNNSNNNNSYSNNNSNNNSYNYGNKKRPVSIEILADNINCDKICKQLRSNGGYDVRITR